jgi:hypothetical protein
VTHGPERPVGVRCCPAARLAEVSRVTEFSVMIVLYARVSTTDQTTAHQAEQARTAGFKIDTVLC